MPSEIALAWQWVTEENEASLQMAGHEPYFRPQSGWRV